MEFLTWEFCQCDVTLYCDSNLQLFERNRSTFAGDWRKGRNLVLILLAMGEKALQLLPTPDALQVWKQEMHGFGDAALTRLRKAGLRPTRQRRELAELLFRGGNEALTAEGLHAHALRNGIKVSLATVYGALHSFRDAGLVREISIDSKRYFDTNIDNHQYFFFEEERKLLSVTEAETGFKQMPPPPEGQRISRIDVVVRLRRE